KLYKKRISGKCLSFLILKRTIHLFLVSFCFFVFSSRGLLGSFSCFLPSTSTTSSFLLLRLAQFVGFVEIYKFDHCHISVISKSVTQFNDSGISSRTISYFRCN